MAAAWLNGLRKILGLGVRQRVGSDKFGNVYYRVLKSTGDRTDDSALSWHERRKREERHVDWSAGGSRAGIYDPDRLPTEWASWLSFRRMDSPGEYHPSLEDNGATPPGPGEALEPHAEARLMRAEKLAGGAKAEDVPVATDGYEPGKWAPKGNSGRRRRPL